MLAPVNVLAAFDRVDAHWSPKIIGCVNDQYLKVAKILGEFVWHAHDHEDELFHVIRGRFRMELEDGAVELREGDMLTVPKGVRHRPVADEECWILLVETVTTQHTGSEVTPLSRTLDDQLA